MRAAAEDGEAAALMGIRLGRISAVAWIIGGTLAAIAGLFLVGSPTPGMTPDVDSVALRALPAAILGGLDSTFGALVGGITDRGGRVPRRPATRTSWPSSAAGSVSSSRTSS